MGQLITHEYVYPGTGVSLMARARKGDATNIVIADITSIAYNVREKVSGTSVASGPLTVADVVYNALQVDGRWDTDGTGYNFRWDAPATIIPDASTAYQVQVEFTPVVGEVFGEPWDLTTLDIIGK